QGSGRWLPGQNTVIRMANRYNGMNESGAQRMLSIQGPPGRLCDSPSRRELLSVGSLSLLGLSLPDFFHLQSIANEQPASPIKSRRGHADAVILVYLQGAPSHIDLWDPKPAAPAEIRG